MWPIKFVWALSFLLVLFEQVTTPIVPFRMLYPILYRCIFDYVVMLIGLVPLMHVLHYISGFHQASTTVLYCTLVNFLISVDVVILFQVFIVYQVFLNQWIITDHIYVLVYGKTYTRLVARLLFIWLALFTWKRIMGCAITLFLGNLWVTTGYQSLFNSLGININFRST